MKRWVSLDMYWISIVAAVAPLGVAATLGWNFNAFPSTDEKSVGFRYVSIEKTAD